jgi:predicted dehydrogenase
VVRGCAARSVNHARATAAEFGIGAYDSVEALLAAPDVAVIVNITPPLAHGETTAAAPAARRPATKIVRRTQAVGFLAR